MPKITRFPRLRSHVRRGKGGQRWVYYFYDMRPEGQKDVPLGKDHAEAIRRWTTLHLKRPASLGRVQEAIDKWRTEVLPTYESNVTRRNYTSYLNGIERTFGPRVWGEIDFAALVKYLSLRSAKTQANREMAAFKLVWDKANLWRMTPLPWPAAGKGKWKNKEQAREVEVSDAAFRAIYEKADQVLRDAMDIASATGMRITDVRSVLLPSGDLLRLKASKTGKKADFDLSLSAVLPQLIERRRGVRARHLMLLSTSGGNRVSERMLTDRWADAREHAAKEASKAGKHDLAAEIRGLFLRDMRKLASNLTKDDEGAAKLLQHSDVNLTRKHYRTKVAKLEPVR